VKIVVIGGSGLIGSRVVKQLVLRGCEAVAASPSSGVNTLTGEGLTEALAGAQVVVDVANSPSFEAEAAMAFFTTAGRNLLAAEKATGVRHHVALSVVGTERLKGMGYFRAKLAQEDLIKAAGIPYSIVRSTQFFEFLASIAAAGGEGESVRLSTALLQPIAADDVAEALAEAALGRPANGTLDIAGPERGRLCDLVGRYLKASGDRRRVVADPQATYFGLALEEGALVPPGAAWLGRTGFADWFASSARRA